MAEYGLSGFSKLPRSERLRRLVRLGYLSLEEASFLDRGAPVNPDLAEHFIENVIGYFQMPLGVATNFRIDGEDKVIPMAVEETSIIAAASSTAKWVKENGLVTTESVGQDIIGQIQLAKVKNVTKAIDAILSIKEELIQRGNQIAEGLVRRGGGVRDLQIRVIDRYVAEDGSQKKSETTTEEKMLVIHVLMDPRDAMGANIINQVCEALKPEIEKVTQEKVTMCILSNLVDTKLTRAKVLIKNIDPLVAQGIEEASLFSQVDPYRAATNNKGVLNGIDAVAVATGNDWRAIEAGVHAYASRKGQYRSITHWKREGEYLVGTLEAPIVVGTVGGMTKLHPTARLCLKLLKIQSAEELSRVMAAVGLVQNLGALRALSTVGIVKGHMKLHTTNLALAAGANGHEIPDLKKELELVLQKEKRVSLTQAVEILEKLRSRHVESLSPQ